MCAYRINLPESSRKGRASQEPGRDRFGFSRMKGIALLVLAMSLSAPTEAQAQWLVTADTHFVLPSGQPQAHLFGPGVGAGVTAYRDLKPWLLFGMRLELDWLSDGEPPMDPNRMDPDATSVFAALLTARLRPQALQNLDDPRRGIGPWIEIGVGGGLTGSVGRAVLSGGFGWAFEWGAYGIGPAFRYTHVVETTNPVDDRDARLLLVGVEGQFLDPRPVPEAPPEPEIADRDGDGIPDAEDGCPDDPEDEDGFEDEDGCPDTDNDEDGILDVDDSCPNEAEDEDGFEDEDGCPDPDNDQDGFQDVVDECPNDAEVVNGVDDHDGCPDEGVIEFIDDRIILDERVLFDTDRARVRSAGRVILRAVLELWNQRPDWVTVQIQGHADARGEEAYNRDLSERRARAVMRVLVDQGADADRLQAVGFGATQLRDRRNSPEAHQRNRRVEFVVIQRMAGEEPVEPETAIEGDAP